MFTHTFNGGKKIWVGASVITTLDSQAKKSVLFSGILDILTGYLSWVVLMKKLTLKIVEAFRKPKWLLLCASFFSDKCIELLWFGRKANTGQSPWGVVSRLGDLKSNFQISSILILILIVPAVKWFMRVAPFSLRSFFNLEEQQAQGVFHRYVALTITITQHCFLLTQR